MCEKERGERRREREKQRVQAMRACELGCTHAGEREREREESES